MRASIIIAAHNEGASLWKTVRSCIESIGKLDYEILIADDASDDGSVKEALRRFPQLSVHRHDQRQGASPTKHLGASNARGEVLVFLDGHYHAEAGAIQRLIEDVERLDGQSLVTPTMLALDTARWKNKESQVGHGYRLELDTFDCGWLPLASLRKVRRAGRQFYESPAAIGCAFAVHRELYDDLRGFDPHMRIWGVEDLDFSLKCWLMGNSIMHDPQARIGHRFRDKFDNYDVPVEHILVNKLRMAYKNFTQAVWSEWVECCCKVHSGGLADHPEGLWACAWKLFEADRASAEQERADLLGRRERDEFWYAAQFGLRWPRLESASFGMRRESFPPMQTEGSEAPNGSPEPPCPLQFIRQDNTLIPTEGDDACHMVSKSVTDSNLPANATFDGPPGASPDADTFRVQATGQPSGLALTIRLEVLRGGAVKVTSTHDMVEGLVDGKTVYRTNKHIRLVSNAVDNAHGGDQTVLVLLEDLIRATLLKEGKDVCSIQLPVGRPPAENGRKTIRTAYLHFVTLNGVASDPNKTVERISEDWAQVGIRFALLKTDNVTPVTNVLEVRMNESSTDVANMDATVSISLKDADNMKTALAHVEGGFNDRDMLRQLRFPSALRLGLRLRFTSTTLHLIPRGTLLS